MITQNHAQHLNNEIDSLLNQLSHDMENAQKESKLKMILHDCQEPIFYPFSTNHAAQNKK